MSELDPQLVHINLISERNQTSRSSLEEVQARVRNAIQVGNSNIVGCWLFQAYTGWLTLCT